MPWKKKLMHTQLEEVIERWKCGESIASICKDFSVTAPTMKRYLIEAGAWGIMREEEPPIRDRGLSSFLKKVRKVLWHLDRDREHQTYNSWKKLVAELKEIHNYPYGVAAVRAAKEFPAVWNLFAKFDVVEFDPVPDSHPGLKHFKKIKNQSSGESHVRNDNIVQTHRENLNWALEAAGEHSINGKRPTSCPNASAYYLFEQALADPKDFMSKISQVEMKSDGGLGAAKKSGQQSVSEIDSMLETLEESETNDS